jgi:hypothetical protein
LREQATVADLAQRYHVPPFIPKRSDSWIGGARVREGNSDCAAEHERKMDRLHSKIGQRIVERERPGATVGSAAAINVVVSIRQQCELLGNQF